MRRSPTLRSQEHSYNWFLQDHPIAPTKFPKGWSAIRLVRQHSAVTEYSMHPSGGGYLLPITP